MIQFSSSVATTSAISSPKARFMRQQVVQQHHQRRNNPGEQQEFTGTPRLLTRARNFGAFPCTDRPNSIRLLEYTPLL